MAAKLPKGADALRGAWERFQGLGGVRRRAAVASAVWVVLVVSYAVGFFGASQARGTVFLDGAFFLVTLALPLILIWLAAFLGEELAHQRDMIAALAELAAPLFGALEATQASLDRHAPASPAEIRKAVEAATLAGRGAEASAALERVLAGQARSEAALQALLDRITAPVPAPGPAAPPPETAPTRPPAAAKRPRAAARPEPASASGEPAGQPGLPLLADPEPEAPLDWGDLVRALDFPRDETDEAGFRALRLALRNRNLAQMLQAAEDVLTLLSQEGVYMDELAGAGATDPGAWRRFLSGERGAAVAGMGGAPDAAALEKARALMKSDPIFRDTALFFQRRFDVALGELAGEAGDDELTQLADTRSGRAFLLMARASGSLD